MVVILMLFVIGMETKKPLSTNPHRASEAVFFCMNYFRVVLGIHELGFIFLDAFPCPFGSGRAGPVQLSPNTPLVQAVLAAGGQNFERARTSRVALLRINRNRTLTRQAVPLDFGSPPSPELNPPMRDGDVVVVYRNNYARFVDTVDAIARPLTGFVTAFTLFRLAEDN